MNNPERIIYCQECKECISRDLPIKAKINRVRNLINKNHFEEIIIEALNISLEIEKKNLEKAVQERNYI